jgi:hypothetical protein
VRTPGSVAGSSPQEDDSTEPGAVGVLVLQWDGFGAVIDFDPGDLLGRRQIDVDSRRRYLNSVNEELIRATLRRQRSATHRQAAHNGHSHETLQQVRGALQIEFLDLRLRQELPVARGPTRRELGEPSRLITNSREPTIGVRISILYAAADIANSSVSSSYKR